VSKYGKLTTSVIFQIAADIREGNADPEDARRLLDLLCDALAQANEQDQIQRWLWVYLKEAFARYRYGRRLLEIADRMQAASRQARIWRTQERCLELQRKAKYFSREAKSLDAAFGLVRAKAGRPSADERHRIALAVDVLRRRLAGKSHEDALADAGEHLSRGRTVMGEAWAAHRFDALRVLRAERPSKPYPWSKQEMDVLLGIFEDESVREIEANKAG